MIQNETATTDAVPEPMDGLIKVADPAQTAPPPWTRVDVDRNGRLVTTIWAKKHAALLVHPRARVDLVGEFRAPSTGAPWIALRATFRLSCPLHAEKDVARRFFEFGRTPRQMFQKHLDQAVDELVAAVTRERFFADVERHLAQMKTMLAARLALLTRLSVEILDWHDEADVPSATPIRLTSHAVDLRDRGAVPIELSLVLDVDRRDARARSRALLMARRQDELTELATRWIGEFFMTVSFAELYGETHAVEGNLRRRMTERVADWGRSVMQLSMALPKDIDTKSVDTAFDCWLADETSVKVSAAGTLWLTGSGGASAAPADAAAAWPRLAEFLKTHAHRYLSPLRYRDFETQREALLEKMASALHDDARRLGVGAHVTLRAEWSHEWLRHGYAFTATIDGAVGGAATDAKVEVWLEGAIDDRPDAPWHRMDKAALDACVTEQVTRIVKEHIAKSRQGEYATFVELRREICEAIEAQMAVLPGLITSSVRVKRVDDFNERTLIELMKHAPTFTVEHPVRDGLKFDVQYRCIGSEVQADGSHFPIYPTSIEELTRSVTGCIREFLIELPVAAASGVVNQRLLRERMLREIPRRVSARYFVNVQILYWIALPDPEVKAFEKALAQLLALRTPTGRDFVPPDWRPDVERLIGCIEYGGGYVPWPELSLYGIQPKRLDAPAANEAKGLVDSGAPSGSEASHPAVGVLDDEPKG